MGTKELKMATPLVIPSAIVLEDLIGKFLYSKSEGSKE